MEIQELPAEFIEAIRWRIHTLESPAFVMDPSTKHGGPSIVNPMIPALPLILVPNRVDDFSHEHDGTRLFFANNKHVGSIH